MESAQEQIGFTYFFVEETGELNNSTWIKINGISGRFWFSKPQPFRPGDSVRITITKEPSSAIPR